MYFLYTTFQITDFDAKSKRQVSSPFLKADEQSLCWREHFETSGFIQRALHKYIIMNELIKQGSNFHREMGLQLPNLWVYIPHKIMWLLTVAASPYCPDFSHVSYTYGISFPLLQINSTFRRDFFCLFRYSIFFKVCKGMGPICFISVHYVLNIPLLWNW